jgi:acyl-CoA synthetase (AMP-forming)/AMP-acid ligase II/aryl carrier-like protein
MVHTYLGEDDAAARARVRQPLRRYLETSLDLVSSLVNDAMAGPSNVDPDGSGGLIERAVDRFIDVAGVFGTPDTALPFIRRLTAAGADEIACMVDFGLDHNEVLAGLPFLDRLRRMASAESAAGLAQRPHAAETVTHIQCTPSYLQVLLATPEAEEKLRHARQVLVGGEVLPEPLARRLREVAVNAVVHNMYGPTEATIWATASKLRDDGPVNLGRPLPGVRAYVVDREMRLVPIGAQGELVLGGDFVTRGYLGRSAITAQRYLPDPFTDRAGGRLYRTGDLVRWKDGDLEFIGRLDQQVKIRGYRIEPGEIESVLAGHPSIAAAAVLVTGSGTERQLVGAIVGRDAADGLDLTGLRAYLAARLPEPMVPKRYKVFDALPVTTNGKVDRLALEKLMLSTAPAHRPRPNGAPHPDNDLSPLRGKIKAVLQDVLRNDEIAVDDNFFSVGGNSVLAAIATARLRKSVDSRLSLIEFFRHPTVAGLADLADAR